MIGYTYEIQDVSEYTGEIRILVTLETGEVLLLKDYRNFLPKDKESIDGYVENRVSNILPTPKSPCTCGSSSQLGICQWCHDQYSKVYEGEIV